MLEIDIGQIQKVSEKVKTEKGLKLKLYEIEIVRKSHGKWQINYCSKDNEIWITLSPMVIKLFGFARKAT